MFFFFLNKQVSLPLSVRGKVSCVITVSVAFWYVVRKWWNRLVLDKNIVDNSDLTGSYSKNKLQFKKNKCKEAKQ